MACDGTHDRLKRAVGVDQMDLLARPPAREETLSMVPVAPSGRAVPGAQTHFLARARARKAMRSRPLASSQTGGVGCSDAFVGAG